jgi:RNA polymerase sigma-70 factor (ECF subfamily)
MSWVSNEENEQLELSIRRAAAGDRAALGAVFEAYRDRLRHAVQLRLDRRLQGRVDASDVLQEAYVDVANRLREYSSEQWPSLYLWLRLIVHQRLLHIHRRHLQTGKRNANLEVSLYRGAMPEPNTASLAEILIGRMTSVSQKAIRAEIQLKLQEMLNAMEPMDREILVLRHFEELSNKEVAQLLEISKTAASNRYVRALRRLKDALASIPDLIDG